VQFYLVKEQEDPTLLTTPSILLTRRHLAILDQLHTSSNRFFIRISDSQKSQNHPRCVDDLRSFMIDTLSSLACRVFSHAFLTLGLLQYVSPTLDRLSRAKKVAYVKQIALWLRTQYYQLPNQLPSTLWDLSMGPRAGIHSFHSSSFHRSPSTRNQDNLKE
jgi:hypothetical protein